MDRLRSGNQPALVVTERRRARLRVRSSGRRILARLLVVAIVAGQAAVALASPAAAAGPTSLGVSGWQVFSNTGIYPNPTPSTQIHGHPSQYAAAPAIPAQGDPGWADCGPVSPLRSSPYSSTWPLCPNATTIGMSVGSILPGCWNNLNFTYFQALVSIPEGTNVSDFSVRMSGADDGARISLVNSQNPGGITPADGYIYQLTAQATGNLAGAVVAGEVNRVVITQVDDCAVGNNLSSAQIFLNGTVIPPKPVNTAPTVAVTGVTHGASYQVGQVPASGCTGSDAEDGAITPTKSVSLVTGLQAGIGLGSQTVTCTAVDSAGASTSATVTYSIIDNVRPTISAAATSSPNGNGWYSGNVIVHFTCSDSGVGLVSGACPADQVLTGEGPAVSSTSATVTDSAGNTSLLSNVVTVAIDRTDPSASATAVSSPNDNGWYADDVVVHITCADPANGSGIAADACPGDQVLADEGTSVSTAVTVTDRADRVSPPSNVVTVAIDRTKPVVTASATTSPNGNGWYNGNVVVHFSCTDAAGGSGVVSCPEDQVLAGEGDASSTAVTTTDKAGNVSSPSNVVTVSIDRTEPAVTAAATTAPNGFGWYDDDVVVDFSCSDAGGSGLASGACPGNQTLTGEGANVSSTAVTVTDRAGNVSSPSNVVTTAIDRTKPVVSFSGPAAYGLLDTVNVTCSATDALSGIASSSCPSTTGPAWSFSPGIHLRTASAADRAGNSNSTTTSFRVTATAGSLCDLVHAFTDHNGTRTSLCAHLTNFERSRSRGQAGPAAAQLDAFRKEAASRSGKQLTAAEVAILIGWANTL